MLLPKLIKTFELLLPKLIKTFKLLLPKLIKTFILLLPKLIRTFKLLLFKFIILFPKRSKKFVRSFILQGVILSRKTYSKKKPTLANENIWAAGSVVTMDQINIFRTEPLDQYIARTIADKTVDT